MDTKRIKITNWKIKNNSDTAFKRWNLVLYEVVSFIKYNI